MVGIQVNIIAPILVFDMVRREGKKKSSERFGGCCRGRLLLILALRPCLNKSQPISVVKKDTKTTGMYGCTY